MKVNMVNLHKALIGEDIAWIKDGRINIVGNGEFYLITDEELSTGVQVGIARKTGKVLKRDGMTGSGFYATEEGRKEFKLTPVPTISGEYKPTGKIVDDMVEIRSVEGDDMLYVPKVYADIVPTIIDTYKYDKDRSMIYLNYGLCFLGIEVR